MIRRTFFIPLALWLSGPVSADDIVFADPAVKALCVAQWDANGDGELSTDEAAAVTTLGTVFSGNQEIASFEELRYFSGLTTINGQAFYQSSLQTVAFPESVTAIEAYAFCQSGISGELRIPGTVKTIGNYAFNECKMTSVVLEEGVETTGWHTFAGPVKTLSLPSTLSYMKSMAIDPYVNAYPSSGAFFPEGDLWVFPHSKEPALIDDFAYFYVFGDGHLVVPFGTVEAYKAVEGWSHFREYIERGDVNADGDVDAADRDLLQQVLAGEAVELKNELLADVNGDGTVDEQDLDTLESYFRVQETVPTQIVNATIAGSAQDGDVYTIDGRKVLTAGAEAGPLPHGIYIRNGKKFIVK